MSTIRQYRSPNGEAIIGTAERLLGTALISGIDAQTGEPIHAGETVIDWNSQETIIHTGGIVYVDESGNEWIFSQLVPVEEEENA